MWVTEGSELKGTYCGLNFVIAVIRYFTLCRMLTCVTFSKHESVTFTTGPYFVVRVSFVTSAALVGGRLNELRS